jgi:predicted dehydrogenase
MTYRIGVIGAGASPDDPDQDGYAMAYRHADAYRARDDCSLVACADIVPENAQQFADHYDISGVYEDYRKMLDKERVDIVSVCVPPRIHADIVRGCADYGDLAAVHCEKPMATSWADCREMCEACERAEIELTFNHQIRFGRVYRKAKALVDDGRIGALRRIEWADEELYDSGTHMFDVSAYLTDQCPVEWVMTALDYREENRWFGVHNSNQALAQWRYESGVFGLATTGRSQDALGAKLRLVGTDGAVEVGVSDGPPLRVRTPKTLGWRTVDVGEDIWGNPEYATRRGLARAGIRRGAETLRTALPVVSAGRSRTTLLGRAIASVIDGIEGDDPSELYCRNALQSTELIFASWESARRRARVDLPLDIDDNPLEAMVEQNLLPVSAGEA